MKENMSRAIRRHHALRLKKARRFYNARDNAIDQRLAGMLLSTPKGCSCWMCGNQRAHQGLTLAEVIHRLRLSD